jgi:DNA-binding response OmpR family regulator
MSDDANKILVVDDSVQVCKALGDVLTASGYSVRTAPSAERALQITETDRFDLVITDLKMTGMNGMDLAKKIFEQMPGVPVVILTGFGDMDAVIAALRSGVADFLKKPFSIDEVLSVVRRELAKSPSHLPTLIPTHPLSTAERPPRVYIFGQRDLDQIDAVLSKLRAQAAAESALLVEQAGYVIAAKGLVNNADLEPISNLIAGARSTSASLASLLGESQDFSTSYMEGQRVSVYNTTLGRGLYLVVIVPKGTKQGLVWLYAKESALDIDRIVRRAADVMQKQVGHTIGTAETDALRQEMAEQKVDNVFQNKAPISLPRSSTAPRSSIRPLGTVSTISFKKDRPTPEVVDSPAPAQEPAQPGSSAPTGPAAPAGPAISFEEALNLGLLNFDGVPPIEAVDSAAPEPAESEPATESTESALSPDTFAAALDHGLLDFEAEAPTDETPSAESTGNLTPDSFAEALKRGLFG